jgi:hypothetical protein
LKPTATSYLAVACSSDAVDLWPADDVDVKVSAARMSTAVSSVDCDCESLWDCFVAAGGDFSCCCFGYSTIACELAG